MMHYRTRELRAAVAKRDRSQGHLRAATATVGAAGVVTAGAVAFILPGATHHTASAQTANAPRPAAPASSQAAPAGAAASGAAASGAAATGHARRHRHHHQSSQGSGAAAPSAPASAARRARPQHGTATDHVRRLLTSSARLLVGSLPDGQRRAHSARVVTPDAG